VTKTAIFALILMACSLVGLLIYRILPNEYGLVVSILFAVAGIFTGLSQSKDASSQEPEWRRNLKEWLSFKKRRKS
jgi:hypothetical protein